MNKVCVHRRPRRCGAEELAKQLDGCAISLLQPAAHPAIPADALGDGGIGLPAPRVRLHQIRGLLHRPGLVLRQPRGFAQVVLRFAIDGAEFLVATRIKHGVAIRVFNKTNLW